MLEFGSQRKSPGPTEFIYPLIYVVNMLPFGRSEAQSSGFQFLKSPRVSFWQVKLGFFILNFGGALAIRLQDPFVRSRVFVEGICR
jgi:hypothetical protein